jgi:hypothetical protein
MNDEANPQWSRHLDRIADELKHLSIACGVRLRDEGVVERILRNDASVCGRKNEIGFEKLQKLLIATFDSLGKSIDRIGPEETKRVVDAIRARQEDDTGSR